MSKKLSPPTTVTGGGSQPDLSKLSEDITDTQVTLRKRKQPDDRECKCSDEIKLMRNELSHITSLLENYVGSNSLILNQMSQSIVEVKSEIKDLQTSQEQTRNQISSNVAELSNQIQDIKLASSKISSEHDNFKTQLAQLVTKISNDEDKIKLLETDFKELKLGPLPTQSNQLSANEQIIREVQERKRRENNIIIVGIPEQNSISTQDRILKDESEVLNITTMIDKNLPKPNKIFRIGKYTPGKTRKIKVCFDKSEPVMLILRSKYKLPDNVKIFSDQTPAQQKYFMNIKDELTLRMKNGESDLTIKYINGIPNIVKSVPKNSKPQ